MFKKSAFLCSFPIVAGGLLMFYYYNNHLSFFPEEFNGNIDAEDNKILREKLAASQSKEYSNPLLGYNTYINNYNSNNYWRSPNIFGNWPDFKMNVDYINSSLGNERINIIRENSVKLETPCGSGTGWFLDYIIPENNSYPTKWFIATNAHVISDMSFKSNDYAQLLPRKLGRGCRLSKGNMLQTPLAIWKEKINSMRENPSLESSKMREYFYGPEKKILNAYNAINHVDKDHENLELIYYVTDNTKLFYVPINFLGKNIKKYTKQSIDLDYYKDFAVLEIDFKTPESAKLITRNFYEKFDRLSGKQKEKALNIFSQELLSNNTVEKLLQNNKSYFVAGYASNGSNAYKSYGNYSPERGRASKLTYDKHRSSLSIKNKYDQNILGHVNVGIIDQQSPKNRVKWADRPLMDWGYNYILDNSWLSSGTSGSLTTDDQGNVLGLYRMHDDTNKLSYVEPLRSKGVYKDGKIILPAYDLIEGTSEQTSSYKSQVQKYYLSRGKATSLSKYRNWTKE